jgi:hypothetical protein
MSQNTESSKTTDGEHTTDEEEPRQHTRAEILANWTHDRQPGWEMYSSQGSEVSVVPCSLEVPLTQVENTTPNMTAPILIPETPEMTKIQRITKRLEEDKYTVFVHKMADGRTMHLAFCLYDTPTW